MTANGQSTRWKATSYILGIVIVLVAITLLCFTALRTGSVDWPTVDLLLLLAAYLLGAPSIVSFVKRRNGNGSG